MKGQNLRLIKNNNRVWFFYVIYIPIKSLSSQDGQGNLHLRGSLMSGAACFLWFSIRSLWLFASLHFFPWGQYPRMWIIMHSIVGLSLLGSLVNMLQVSPSLSLNSGMMLLFVAPFFPASDFLFLSPRHPLSVQGLSCSQFLVGDSEVVL